MDERARLRRELIETIVHMGYPEEFGAAVADNLRTEKTMSRMIGYLHHARPRSMEEIADEMLAIMEDRERWTRKKSAEYYNMKYNEMRDWMAEAAESGELEEGEDPEELEEPESEEPEEFEWRGGREGAGDE